MDGAEDIAESVTELQNVLLGTESIEKFVHELAVQAARLVADSLSCAITLSQTGRMSTVACSDNLAARVNSLQYDLEEGPCLAALREGEPMRVEDTAAETRWPRFCGQDKAFTALRAASQNRNLKLRQVAGEIVAEVTGEAPQSPPFIR